jgi:hypothetical protein
MERNMMRFNTLVGIILFFFTFSVLPTTINGRFTVLEEDSSKFIVRLQINTNTGTDDLGGSTIVFNFDTTAISFTGNPIKDVDYVFHNFCSGNYSLATVTRPMQDKIWVNIDLPFNNNNNGTVVAASPDWTDVVTIYFNIIDPNDMANLSWLTASPFWGIYDADNLTLWEKGVFEGFPTSVEPGSTLPTNFELSQNYPNPFNPSTTIQFAITNESNVNLSIYNALGELVSTLVNEQLKSGYHQYEFDASNLASGIYIYRIIAGDFVETKKMVLLR